MAAHPPMCTAACPATPLTGQVWEGPQTRLAFTTRGVRSIPPSFRCSPSCSPLMQGCGLPCGLRMPSCYPDLVALPPLLSPSPSLPPNVPTSLDHLCFSLYPSIATTVLLPSERSPPVSQHQQQQRPLVLVRHHRYTPCYPIPTPLFPSFPSRRRRLMPGGDNGGGQRAATTVTRPPVDWNICACRSGVKAGAVRFRC